MAQQIPEAGDEWAEPTAGQSLATSMRSLIAAYCRRPAVRHELGLAEGTPLEATVLAQSAYDLTYLVQAPDGRRWAARLSIGSATGLSSSKQIAYEARVLRFLEPFHIAPQLCYVDATLYHLPYGFLVMEYLPGESFDPHNRAHILPVAQLLARLHSTPIPGDTELMHNPRPLSTLVEAAEQYQSIYRASPAAQPAVVDLLQRALTAARAALIHEPLFQPAALVHNNLQRSSVLLAPSRPALLPLAGLQALGSTKLLPRLVGWTRPLLDDPTNDLCHLFASTPAHLHTASTFTPAEQAAFLAAYLHARPNLDAAALRDRVALRMRFVYLRAFSWYAFTQTQRTAGAVPSHTDTLPTTTQYLDSDRLRSLFGDWL